MGEWKQVANAADRLRDAMDAAGKKQTELSEETGLAKSSISRYLSGETEPKQKALMALAKALDVSELWLWGYDVPMHRSEAQKNNDSLVETIVKGNHSAKVNVNKDPEFAAVVSKLAGLPDDQYNSIKQLILSLSNK